MTKKKKENIWLNNVCMSTQQNTMKQKEEKDEKVLFGLLWKDLQSILFKKKKKDIRYRKKKIFNLRKEGK